jgi:hypothetical protein
MTLTIPTSIAILIILVLAFLAGWFVIWQGREIIEEPLPTLPPVPLATTKEEQEEKIDISNWKTYRNEEFGFELRYPED